MYSPPPYFAAQALRPVGAGRHPPGTRELVTLLCGFGNSLTLPMILLLAVLPSAYATNALAATALFLAGWSPVFWSLGYHIVGRLEGIDLSFSYDELRQRSLSSRSRRISSMRTLSPLPSLTAPLAPLAQLSDLNDLDEDQEFNDNVDDLMGNIWTNGNGSSSNNNNNNNNNPKVDLDDPWLSTGPSLSSSSSSSSPSTTTPLDRFVPLDATADLTIDLDLDPVADLSSDSRSRDPDSNQEYQRLDQSQNPERLVGDTDTNPNTSTTTDVSTDTKVNPSPAEEVKRRGGPRSWFSLPTPPTISLPPRAVTILVAVRTVAKRTMNPPLWGILIGAILGLSPLGSTIVLGKATPHAVVAVCSFPLRLLFEIAQLLGGAALAVQAVVLGTSLTTTTSSTSATSTSSTFASDRLSPTALASGRAPAGASSNMTATTSSSTTATDRLNASRSTSVIRPQLVPARFGMVPSGWIAYWGDPDPTEAPAGARSIWARIRNHGFIRWVIPSEAWERRVLGAAVVVRLLVMPCAGLALFVLAAPFLPKDPVVRLACLLQSAMPSAQNLVVLLQARDFSVPLARRATPIMLRLYMLAVIPVAIWMTIFAVVAGVTL